MRTRISRPANTDRYGPRLWSHILSDQLQDTAAEFWNCVDHKGPLQRGPAPNTPDAAVLPASLAYQHVHTLQMSYTEIAELTPEEAVRLMAE
jgi:hypothetical protein